MIHKKILKRENGSTVKIEIVFYEWASSFDYKHTITVTSPNKKVFFVDNSAATPEEIHAAKLELWEKMKPTL